MRTWLHQPGSRRRQRAEPRPQLATRKSPQILAARLNGSSTLARRPCRARARSYPFIRGHCDASLSSAGPAHCGERGVGRCCASASGTPPLPLRGHRPRTGLPLPPRAAITPTRHSHKLTRRSAVSCPVCAGALAVTRALARRHPLRQPPARPCAPLPRSPTPAASHHSAARAEPRHQPPLLRRRRRCRRRFVCCRRRRLRRDSSVETHAAAQQPHVSVAAL